MVKKNQLITAANFRDFDWNKAKLFYHIAKCGSFIKAARVANIDQPSLTRQIQSLEKQIGSPLLIRKAGGIVLTRKGEELLEKVAPFFLEMRGFCGNSFAHIGKEKKRKIRIATTHALAAYVIGDPLLDYAKNNPHLSFELIGDDYFIDIILNDIDVAIQSLDTQIKDKKMIGTQWEHLFSLEKKLYASAEYINIYGIPKTVEDLVNHQIIVFRPPAMHHYYRNINWILSLGMPEGESHSPRYTSNSIESLVNAAKKGIGIIASYEKYKIIRNSSLINILPHIKDKPFEVYFIYLEYLKGDEIIIDIKNYLIEKLNP